MGLLACPFCREMFEEGEAQACPVCGMALTKFHELPPSHDAMADEGGVPTAPEMAILPWKDLSRGKGVLLALSAVGMAMFFLPWVRLTMPYIAAQSAFDLATNRIGWLWGAFVAWVVLVPTVMSRRSVLQLRGARVAAAFLSAVPTVAIAILLLFPPHGRKGIPVRFTFDWPMYVMLAVSLAAVAVSVFKLGGRMDDITLPRGNSAGRAIH